MKKIYKLIEYRIEKSEYLELREKENEELLKKNVYYELDDNTYKYYEDIMLENGKYEIKDNNIIFSYLDNSYKTSFIDNNIVVRNESSNKEITIYVFKSEF